MSMFFSIHLYLEYNIKAIACTPVHFLVEVAKINGPTKSRRRSQLHFDQILNSTVGKLNVLYLQIPTQPVNGEYSSRLLDAENRTENQLEMPFARSDHKKE